jgi:VCBS repeat-containing protein
VENVDQNSTGLFLLSDGDRENRDGRESMLEDGDALTFQQDDDGNWQAVMEDGYILQADQGGGLFFTDEELNPDNLDHEQDVPTSGNQNWEDLIGGGDNDFNDFNADIQWEAGESAVVEFPLDITTNLTDTDGSESLSIQVSGFPEGAELSAGTDNDDGTWTLTADDLEGLTIQVPGDSAPFNLTVSATATENDGDSTSISQSVELIPDNTAEAPTLEIDDAAGTEDVAISLNITSGLTDVDGSESLSINIDGVPDGASLSNGTNNGDGSWTLDSDDLEGLSITPAQNSDTDFTLSVTATSSEGNDSASVTGTINVSVAADADAPTLVLESASGTEDQAIALDISTALTDTDGSESLSITINGVPDGASLSNGSDNGDGSWALETADLDGLTITPATDSDTDFELTVTTTSTEANSGSVATTSGTIQVSVEPADDAAVIGGEISGTTTEDAGQAISGTLTITDADSGEASFVAATTNGSYGTLTVDSDGEWSYGLDDAAQSLTAGQVVTDTIEVASADGTIQNVTITVTGTDDTPIIDGTTSGAVKEDSAQTVNGSLTVTDADSGQDGFVAETITSSQGSLTIDSAGEWSYQLDNSAAQSMYEGEVATDVIEVTTLDGTTQAINISITGTIDSPTLSVVENVSGEEDSAIALNISAALTDIGGSEALSITIGNVPSGATLSAGSENPDNSWTLTTDDLDGLTITPDDDSDDDFTLSVTATYNEGGETATTTSSINVSIESDDDDGDGETIYGSDRSDHIRGGDGDDTIYGGNGNDHVDGKDGDDFLDGGDGNDKIHGNDGDDIIYGGDGNDKIDGNDDDDTLYGNDGNDHIHGGDGDDAIFGNDGNDHIHGDDGDDTILGNDGNDTIYGGKGDDIIDGGEGNDKLELKSSLKNFTITENDDGSYTVYDKTGKEGTDTVRNVETLSYKGGHIDISDAASQSVVDPIVIDLNGDGINITTPTDGLNFNMSPDGLLQAVGWIDSQDGFLVMDKNSNGQVDDISEMFSEFYHAGADTGLGALSTLDENGDSVLDSQDSEFSQLQIWQDSNSDGQSDAGEMHSLADYSISQISLASSDVNEWSDGGVVLSQGNVTYEDGSEGLFGEVGLEVESGVDTTADILSAFTDGDGIQVQVTQQALMQEDQSGLADDTTALSDSSNSYSADGGVLEAFMSGSGITVEVQEESSEQFDNDDADALDMDGDVAENININDFYVSGGNTEDEDSTDAEDTAWVAPDDAGADVELNHDVDPAVF